MTDLRRRTRERNFKIFRLRGMEQMVRILISTPQRQELMLSCIEVEIGYIKEEQENDG